MWQNGSTTTFVHTDAAGERSFTDEPCPFCVPACPRCGAPMTRLGAGAYPYACTRQDKEPDAEVFAGCEAGCETGWTTINGHRR